MLSLKYRFTFILFLIITGLYFVLPNFLENNLTRNLSKQRLKLGLDLRGGSYLLLKVDFPKYLYDNMTSLLSDVRSKLDAQKIEYSDLYLLDHRIHCKTKASSYAMQHALHHLSNNITINSKHKSGITIAYNSKFLTSLQQNVLEESISRVQRRIDETGTREISLQIYGRDKILLQVPGITQPEKLKSLLGRTAKLTFHLIAENSTKNILIRTDRMGHTYHLNSRTEIGGEALKHASISFSRDSKPIVTFALDQTGAQKFALLTKKNVNKRLAILLDDLVLAAPLISEPILNGSGEIKGNFTLNDAKELAILLRSGALPAPLTIVQESIIGPSLGAQEIKSGIFAGITALLLVSLFMIIVYRIYGIYASLTLYCNLLFILAILIISRITLTLPGIAGIILTIGMAVDANILIFESIKDNLRNGYKKFVAIEKGFKAAFATILDANITTLVAAFIMFVIGIGSIRGFAITLSIGILSSIFAAIFITKTLIIASMRYNRARIDCKNNLK